MTVSGSQRTQFNKTDNFLTQNVNTEFRIKGAIAMLPLKNRFIFAPIKTGYSDANGVVTERHFSFYKERAKFLGAVIPEPFYLDKGF